jgi:tetratricopeptide (TPR) repeat protein
MDGSQIFTMLTYRHFIARARVLLRLPVVVVVVGLLVSFAGTTRAEEPILEFVEGLRERQYFDTALEYLDAVPQRADLSPELRDVIDLERAKTLQAMGAASRVPEDRDVYLQQAKEALQKFTSAHSNHPQAAFANSMLGELLLERARTLIWQMDGAESPEKRTEYQLAARKLIDEGQVIYQAANDQYKTAFEKFPNFIDKTKDEEQYAARQDAEAKYLRAWFNLIRCTYERGQTFDQSSEERKNTLINAAGLYEQLHTRYRTNQIGLHARLMMGKCFQEQDDISRALGIYNEMLGHKSESDAVEVLKAIALHYRLICLNDPQRNDHQLVVQEATVWLQANKTKISSSAGLGILWERAIASEKLGGARELAENDREATLRVALNDAATVARYQGPFREPANAMSRRIKAALGDKDKEPKDFPTAFERAKNMIGQIQTLTDDVTAAADDNTRAQKKAALEAHLMEVGRLLQLALDLRDSDSDLKAVAQARYLQSFVMLKLGRPLDSLILAKHCMINDRTNDPDTALNATEIAMAAAVSAWNMAPSNDRDFETRALKDVCQTILKFYPQSSRGGEARMRLATVYRTMNEPLEAAKWYLEVPETDPQYASARISAGQSYWAAWTQKSALAAEDPENNQTQPADMQAWKAEAKNLLTQGIKVTRDKVGADSKPSDELVAAEVSLASIMNLEGDFKGTIDRLTTGRRQFHRCCDSGGRR